MIGRQSIIFDKKTYLEMGATVVGRAEGNGPLKQGFDIILEDDLAGENTWEEAESKLQQLALDELLIKCGTEAKDVGYIFGGDLLGQIIATSFGVMKYDIPTFGLYGACSTIGEAIGLSAMCVNAGYASKVVALSSSHFASAEKQFRFPLGYGNQRPEASTWTVTGAGAYLITTGENCDGANAFSNEKSNVKENNNDANAFSSSKRIRIKGITTGKIIDYGIKDSMNMGACMAPAAADTILGNLMDLSLDENYYDLIITGDLGRVGREILSDLLKEQGINVRDRLKDCGIEIYSKDADNAYSGGSGCGCSSVVLNSFVIPNMLKGFYKKVLFVPTGALLSTVSFNEGKSVPGIAHAVMLEVEGE